MLDLRRVRSRGVAIGISLAILVAGCGDLDVSPDAVSQAQELESQLAAQGVDLPAETGATVFAEDGAHLCAAADEGADHLALVAFTPYSFALRKTEIDSEDVAAARAVVGIYCPENLDNFEDYVDGLSQGDSS